MFNRRYVLKIQDSPTKLKERKIALFFNANNNVK